MGAHAYLDGDTLIVIAHHRFARWHAEDPPGKHGPVERRRALWACAGRAAARAKAGKKFWTPCTAGFGTATSRAATVSERTKFIWSARARATPTSSPGKAASCWRSRTPFSTITWPTSTCSISRRTDCERIYVGKKKSVHAFPQEEICAMMIERARRGPERGASQRRRPIHLRPRRRRIGGAGRRRRSVRSGAGRHFAAGNRGLQRHSAHASRPHQGGDFRDRPRCRRASIGAKWGNRKRW